MTLTVAGGGSSDTVTVWRDYDREAMARVPGISLGRIELKPSAQVQAADLYARGARCVTWDSPVDLDSPDTARTVRALCFIRDLTSWGFVVGWQLKTGTGLTDWRALGHLYPPAHVTCAGSAYGEELRTEWAQRYHMSKCVSRRGPGLLQIRDRRWDGLRRITITRPAYFAAIAALEPGALTTAIPSRILGYFAAEHLVGQVGDISWWLPCQLRRWPISPALI